MKKIILPALLSILILAAKAQTEVQHVTQRQATFDAGLLNPDSLKFEKLLADSLSYGHSVWKIEDKKAFFDDILHSGPKFGSINVTSQTVSVAGDNAIVREVFEADLISKGETTHVKLGILLVWQKQKKEWRLLARQAVKLP